MRLIILILLTFMFSSIFAQDSGLKVIITGIEENEGELLISVFTDAETFLKESDNVMKMQVDEGMKTAEVVFEGLKPGIYAVSVIHDLDKNGKLNMGSFGPKEPYGFSNDAKGFMGPPKFEDCTFEYPGDDFEVSIEL